MATTTANDPPMAATRRPVPAGRPSGKSRKRKTVVIAMNGTQSASLINPNQAAPGTVPGFVTRPWASREPARLKKASKSPFAQNSHPIPLSGRRTATTVPTTENERSTSPNPTVADTLRAMSAP